MLPAPTVHGNGALLPNLLLTKQQMALRWTTNLSGNYSDNVKTEYGNEDEEAPPNLPEGEA